MDLKVIVVNENTLGYQVKRGEIHILAAPHTKRSRFANYNGQHHFLLYSSDVVRDATQKDFETFRVRSEGFVLEKEM